MSCPAPDKGNIPLCSVPTQWPQPLGSFNSISSLCRPSLCDGSNFLLTLVLHLSSLMQTVPNINFPSFQRTSTHPLSSLVLTDTSNTAKASIPSRGLRQGHGRHVRTGKPLEEKWQVVGTSCMCVYGASEASECGKDERGRSVHWTGNHWSSRASQEEQSLDCKELAGLELKSWKYWILISWGCCPGNLISLKGFLHY